MSNIVRPLLYIIALMIVHLNFVKSNQSYVESSLKAKNWRESVGLGKEILVTNLHFFFHNKVGENATVAVLNNSTSKTYFGILYVIDDPLKVSADPMSAEMGRAQGIVAGTGRDEVNVIMVSSFSFSTGPFKGSSLSMLSENPISHPVRELSIVGGTGQFRLAQGVAEAKTIKYDAFNAIIEYNVKVVH